MAGGVLVQDSEPAFVDCRFHHNVSGAGSGGIHVTDNSAPIIIGCEFRSNGGRSSGAVSIDRGSSALISHSILTENTSWTQGGAILAQGFAQTAVVGCTITHNGGGGGVIAVSHGQLEVTRTIIAFSAFAASVVCTYAGTIALDCCDIYGNAGGDWIGCIADQLGTNGNICEDPLFCGPEDGDFTLAESSPCAPFTPPNPECDLIGAWPVGCGPAVVPDVPEWSPTEVTWGHLKSVFRR